MSNININPPDSPRWNSTTKLIVSLLFMLGVVALLIRFSNLLSLLIAALIFSVIFYPIAEWIHTRSRIPWRLTVGILYILVFLIIIGLFTLGGIALLEQIQGLVFFLQRTIQNIPTTLEDISHSVFYVGPFQIDLTNIDWVMIGNELLAVIQPALTRIGNVIGGIAGGALGFVGSFLLSLILSYLLVSESGGVRDQLLKIEIRGYQRDLQKLGERFNHIWNAFLRGQSIVFGIRVVIYIALLGFFGVRFFIGLALLAGLANFIPYVGVAIAWIVFFLVAFFQGTTTFGLDPLIYALIVTISAWIIDNLYDNAVTPRVMGGALNLHPAAITIAALVGLNLFGLLGMVLAAPLLASLKLLAQYAEKKMLDQNPWESEETPNIDNSNN